MRQHARVLLAAGPQRERTPQFRLSAGTMIEQGSKRRRKQSRDSLWGILGEHLTRVHGRFVTEAGGILEILERDRSDVLAIRPRRLGLDETAQLLDVRSPPSVRSEMFIPVGVAIDRIDLVLVNRAGEDVGRSGKGVAVLGEEEEVGILGWESVGSGDDEKPAFLTSEEERLNVTALKRRSCIFRVLFVGGLAPMVINRSLRGAGIEAESTNEAQGRRLQRINWSDTPRPGIVRGSRRDRVSEKKGVESEPLALQQLLATMLLFGVVGSRRREDARVASRADERTMLEFEVQTGFVEDGERARIQRRGQLRGDHHWLCRAGRR